jgi:hypothetical protein
MAEINYTVDTNDTQEGFDVIPAGEYPAVITASEYNMNKQGTGKVLALTYEIIDGHFNGSKLFNYLNLEHQKENVVAMARRTLNAIGVAVGITSVVTNSEMLHNIPMKIEVGVKDDPNYGKGNVIKKHAPINVQASPQAPAPAQGVEQPPIKNDTPPKRAWEK